MGDISIKVIVNGREKPWTHHDISYEQVVALSGLQATQPTTLFTVTYKNGPTENPEGIMVCGVVVKVKDGMVFNVALTDKS